MLGDLGALVALVGFVMVVVAAVFYGAALRQSKAYEAARETASTERARADAHKATADERASALERTTSRIEQLEQLLDREKEKKDTGPILEQLVKQGKESADRQVSIMQAFSRHEARAIERQEGLVELVGAIAKKLNGS